MADMDWRYWSPRGVDDINGAHRPGCAIWTTQDDPCDCRDPLPDTDADDTEEAS